MAFRGCIPDFQIANPLYIGATVSFYTVDSNGHATQTLANLFIDPTSSTPALNPQTLDSEGKFASPVYIEVPVIAVVTGPNVASHSTGVINARGTWRGNWAADTVYFSSDFLLAFGSVYAAASDYTSSSSAATDIANGNLILILSASPSSLVRAQRSITTSDNLPITLSDSILNFNASSDLTPTVPAGSGRSGAPLTFKLLLGSHSQTLGPTGTDTFDGETSLLVEAGQSLTLVPYNDGVNTGYAIE